MHLTTPRNIFIAVSLLVIGSVLIRQAMTSDGSEVSDPVQALLITGGGWHDFEAQKTILTEGISERANVEWTIVHEDGEDPEAGDHKFSILLEDNWSAGYDVIVYSHCGGNVTDDAFIESITQEHYENELPAVVLHCAIHSYRRAETSAWNEFTGVFSTWHESHIPFDVENLAPEHPVMRDFPETWTTPNGELYVIELVHETATPLANAPGAQTEEYEVTIWTNEPGSIRVFGTTIGHHNETMEHEVYLDLVTRGLLWTVDRLDDDGRPAVGYGR